MVGGDESYFDAAIGNVSACKLGIFGVQLFSVGNTSILYDFHEGSAGVLWILRLK